MAQFWIDHGPVLGCSLGVGYPWSNRIQNKIKTKFSPGDNLWLKLYFLVEIEIYSLIFTVLILKRGVFLFLLCFVCLFDTKYDFFFSPLSMQSSIKWFGDTVVPYKNQKRFCHSESWLSWKAYASQISRDYIFILFHPNSWKQLY